MIRLYLILYKNYAWWWRGDARSQGISNHVIGQLHAEYTDIRIRRFDARLSLTYEVVKYKNSNMQNNLKIKSRKSCSLEASLLVEEWFGHFALSKCQKDISTKMTIMGEWDFARLQFQTDFGWILDRLFILLRAPGACYILVCCLSQLNYQKLENHKGQFRRGLTGLVWQKYSLVGYLSSQRKAWDSGNMMASCHGEPFLITGPVGREYTSQNGEQCDYWCFCITTDQ